MSDLNFLTTPEVLALLRISDPTLRRWIAQGFLPAYKTPTGALRFKADEVRALLQPHPAKETVTTQP